MIIELDKVVFTNDIFSTMLPNGNYIVLNKIDEDFTAEGFEGESIVTAVNIELVDVEGNSIPCPTAIGLGNELMQIKTDYKEYEGDVLSPYNMAFCTIEIYDL